MSSSGSSLSCRQGSRKRRSLARTAESADKPTACLRQRSCRRTASRPCLRATAMRSTQRPYARVHFRIRTHVPSVPPDGVARAATARDQGGVVRYYRHDSVVTGWEIKGDQPGRLTLKNPVLYRKSELCQAIERELMSVLGIDQVQDQLADLHGPGRLRPAAAQQAPGHRDPRLGPRQRRAPDQARQARPSPAGLHGLAAARGGGPVRLPAALAGGGGGVRLHVDPDVQGGAQGPVQGETARRGRPRRRSW